MVGEDQTVIAQNYALGISVLGFILYPVLNRAVHERFKALLTFSTVLVSIICIFLIQQHISYAITLTAGLILFFLMGLFGSSAHYLAVCTIHGERTLARLVGFAYAGGILLQYINNNLINIEIAEAVILSCLLHTSTSYRCRFSSTIPSLDCYNIHIREKELNQLVYELLCKQFQVAFGVDSLADPVSYTHLDVYKRQLLH